MPGLRWSKLTSLATAFDRQNAVERRQRKRSPQFLYAQANSQLQLPRHLRANRPGIAIGESFSSPMSAMYMMAVFPGVGKLSTSLDSFHFHLLAISHTPTFTKHAIETSRRRKASSTLRQRGQELKQAGRSLMSLADTTKKASNRN